MLCADSYADCKLGDYLFMQLWIAKVKDWNRMRSTATGTTRWLIPLLRSGITVLPLHIGSWDWSHSIFSTPGTDWDKRIAVLTFLLITIDR
jgi:hypothetical protein